MRLLPPRSPDRHLAVGSARRPTPSVEDEPRAARPSPGPTSRNRPWLPLVAAIVFLALLLGPDLVGSSKATALSYSTFLTDVAKNEVTSVRVSSTGALGGTLTGGREFTSQAPPWALTTDDLASKLEAAGVQRIEDVDLCTSCREDLFFSHRRDHGVTGRQGGVAWLA